MCSQTVNTLFKGWLNSRAMWDNTVKYHNFIKGEVIVKGSRVIHAFTENTSDDKSNYLISCSYSYMYIVGPTSYIYLDLLVPIQKYVDPLICVEPLQLYGDSSTRFLLGGGIHFLLEAGCYPLRVACHYYAQLLGSFQ